MNTERELPNEVKHKHTHFFGIRTIFYKNVEAEIGEIPKAEILLKSFFFCVLLKIKYNFTIGKYGKIFPFSNRTN